MEEVFNKGSMEMVTGEDMWPGKCRTMAGFQW